MHPEVVKFIEDFEREAKSKRQFTVSRRTALYWLTRFVEEQIFIPIRPKSGITGYRLAGYGS
jgi:hypothetical protein